LANPDKDGRYFNTSPLEITVLDRFTIKLYVDMYDLGADQYLLERYPQHAPAVMEWVLSLPEDKRWLVPPRTQESVIEAYLMGEPVRYVFTEDVSLPVHQLEESLRSGDVWTVKRMLQSPRDAADSLQRKPVLMPLFVALLRQIKHKRDAQKVVPLLKVLPDSVRFGLWNNKPEVWTDVLTDLNVQINGGS
jgi:predicted nucleic acid-binding protein